MRWGEKLRSLESQASEIMFVPLPIENHPVVTFPVLYASCSCRKHASLKRECDDTELKSKGLVECKCTVPRSFLIAVHFGQLIRRQFG